VRTYGQYCGLAKALDIVGDRWTLLIVRELLIRGRCRYTDLKDGLPGIATNLLAARLVELEQAAVLRRETAPPPVATTLYELTPRGAELEPVIEALGRWAGPLMTAPARREAFRSHWLALPLQLYLTDRSPTRPPITVELRAGAEPVTLETSGGAVRARPGAAQNPDVVLTGPPQVLLSLLLGRIDVARARAAGLKWQGDPTTLKRLQPRSSSHRVRGNV
jgi:DNA-binding HxlR family transcriptional regulator